MVNFSIVSRVILITSARCRLLIGWSMLGLGLTKGILTFPTTATPSLHTHQLGEEIKKTQGEKDNPRVCVYACLLLRLTLNRIKKYSILLRFVGTVTISRCQEVIVTIIVCKSFSQEKENVFSTQYIALFSLILRQAFVWEII